MDLDALALASVGGSALTLGPAWSADQPPPVLQNPAEVLAALMDFSGSVALAELLAAPAPEGPSHPDAQRLGAALIAEVGARLDALLPLALKPLVGRRAPSLPAPHELFALVHELAGGAVPDEAAAGQIARALGDPLRSALGASLRQAQAHVATMRWEVTHELRALGPRAARLERIDAALNRAIQSKLGALLDRMEFAAELTFSRACVHACAALSPSYGEAELAPWLARDGWIERFRERSARMTRALFGHLRRSLEGLLRAALRAEGL